MINRRFDIVPLTTSVRSRGIQNKDRKSKLRKGMKGREMILKVRR